MSDKKQLSLTSEGFVWFKWNVCEFAWQTCNNKSDCPECGSFNIGILEKETEKQEDHE